MKWHWGNNLLFFGIILLLAGCNQGVTHYVNPFVGTDFHGHTYPGAIVPFGQIQPSPDTRLEGWDGCSAYHYSDDTIYGFSHTHLSGTGCEDYGDILLMPVMSENDEWSFSPNIPYDEYKSHFSHRSEKAQPGYYRVVLDRNRVMVELTTTKQVAAHRYTFPKRGKKGFVIDLRHRDRVIEAGFNKWQKGERLTGWRVSSAWNPEQKCYFALECNTDIEDVRFYDGGWKALVVLPNDCKQAEVYVSISGVDCQGACGNLDTRGDAGFKEMRLAATNRWEEALGKIEVTGGSRTELRNFYTALYHCYTSPYLWSDADGRYRGMDDSIYFSETPIYTVFSLWDTYRALHPLMTILEPATTEAWINTMLRHFETGGELTMWELAAHETHCMIGYHACPVILEAYRGGVLDQWTPERKMALLNAMVATSNRTEAHRTYATQGYVDSQSDNESVSKTLEYAYDDWCIATYASLLLADCFGNDSNANHLRAVESEYMRRASSWQNLMDENGFMHGRRNGGFTTPFNPTEVNNHYTEANSWQYSSYVPHDIEGWIAMMGGSTKAELFLDSLFNTSSETTGRDQSDITGMIGQYAHGNEPSHHAAYLYAFLGRPEKTDKIVHQILSELYTPKPDGLCGNEDCGQMSAWYVMSAMGFYHVCPGSGLFVTTKSLFDRVTIHREDGDIHIGSNTMSSGLLWNMKDNSFVEASSAMPKATRATPAPYYSDWQQSYEDTTMVKLAVHSLDNNTSIYYTTDGSTPDTHSTRYTQPIPVSRDMTLKAVAYNHETGYSPVVKQTLTRFIADKRLTYITKPAPQYSENGTRGLIDRLYGTTNYRIGGWQGWQGDMEVVLDLLQVKTVVSVGVDCLENMRSWVFFPKRVEVSLSSDGQTYTPWASIDNTEFATVRERQEESVQHTFTCRGPYRSARYIKIKAINYGAMPDWHVSAGEQAWLFADEITVDNYVATFFGI